MQHHLPVADAFTHVPQKAFSAICEKHLLLQPSDTSNSVLNCQLVASLFMSAEAIPNSFQCDVISVIPNISEEELRQSQRNDPAINEINHQFETDETSLPVIRKEIPQLSILLPELNKPELQNGILYRERKVGEDTQCQLVCTLDVV